MVYTVSGQRWGVELRVGEEKVEAYTAGEEIFVDLIYLPEDPSHVERTSGARLRAAGRDTLQVYGLMAFRLTFAVIGGVVTRIARKHAPCPSTGPHT